jgi:hypothetical protein
LYVAENALGRRLPAGAEVHHVDGDKHNNEPSNLVICQDAKYHALLHRRQRIRDAGGDPNTDKICGRCRLVLPVTEFHRRSVMRADGRQQTCKACVKAA